DVCEENTFSSDGFPPCTDCPEGETSGLGAIVCEELSTPSPTVVQDRTPAPTPSPTTGGTLGGPTPSPTTGGSSVALGCYEDDRGDRIMDDLALSDYSMTTEVI
ncbi:unnamed protein product, partial [Ectocarpus fasciculatus]